MNSEYIQRVGDRTDASAEPLYFPVANEEQLFRAADREQLAVILKGPTGVGKTRFVEWMAHRLGRPLITVACHEDLTAADLVGRYLLKGGETVWEEGPLTTAVRMGAICYLDEIVEARSDSIVVIHPLTDHRRMLTLERLDQTLIADPKFMIVASYNPGYQSILKDLKQSTRQRFVSIELGFPPPEVERQVLSAEAGASTELASDLVRFAHAIRRLDAAGLAEASSTRSLVAAARLVRGGVPVREAVLAGIIGPLTDDPRMGAELKDLVDAYFL
ncbi:MAG TPA: CbbQ/NirQ/NorQ/GpvN family protein [Sphingomicrobium sp.]|nr:CbbQ/NirQ/NorQ/GpvN family protein [Sphingomicrobium sp.]